jgi:hypothetical protein
MSETTQQAESLATDHAESCRLSDPDDWARILDSFEDTWQGDTAPRIDDFLPSDANNGDCPRVWNVAELLEELVKIDIEYRWRLRRKLPDGCGRPTWGGWGPRLEDYAVRYRQLGTFDALSVELIGEEYRVRQQWGDRPALQEFLNRFPSQAGALRQLFCRIDRELAVEDAARRWSAAMPQPAPENAAATVPRHNTQEAPGSRAAGKALAEPWEDDTALIPQGWFNVAGRVNPWQRMVRWAKRRRMAAALLVIVSIALTGLAAGAAVVNARLRADVERTDEQ